MPIQFVGYVSSTKVGASSGNSTHSLTSLSGGIGSAPIKDDLVLSLYATGSTNDRTLSITDGSTAYTLIGSERYSASDWCINLRLTYKWMGVTPDTTVTFGPTGSTSDAGVMFSYVLRGVHLTDPFGGVASVGYDSANEAPNPSAITPVYSGSWIIVMAAEVRSGIWSGTNWPYLSGLIPAAQNDTCDCTAMMGYYSGWTGGSYNPDAMSSWSAVTNRAHSAITLALRPAPSGRSPSGGVIYEGFSY